MSNNSVTQQLFATRVGTPHVGDTYTLTRHSRGCQVGGLQIHMYSLPSRGLLMDSEGVTM
jgi:hypothetical protein